MNKPLIIKVSLARGNRLRPSKMASSPTEYTSKKTVSGERLKDPPKSNLSPALKYVYDKSTENFSKEYVAKFPDEYAAYLKKVCEEESEEQSEEQYEEESGEQSGERYEEQSEEPYGGQFKEDFAEHPDSGEERDSLDDEADWTVGRSILFARDQPNEHSFSERESREKAEHYLREARIELCAQLYHSNDSHPLILRTNFEGKLMPEIKDTVMGGMEEY